MPDEAQSRARSQARPGPQGELAQLAVACAAGGDRPAWEALLAFDEALARALVQTREPMLAQIRLAWWRDQLVTDSPGHSREPLVAAIDRAFGTRRAELAAVVDGWEQLLAPPPLGETALEGFALGRARGFAALACVLCGENVEDAVLDEARLWALADFAAHSSAPDEAAAALALARPLAARRQPLGRRLRPLAVLAGMARRAVLGNRRPLLGDRLSPFVAARIALLGR